MHEEQFVSRPVDTESASVFHQVSSSETERTSAFARASGRLGRGAEQSAGAGPPSCQLKSVTAQKDQLVLQVGHQARTVEIHSLVCLLVNPAQSTAAVGP